MVIGPGFENKFFLKRNRRNENTPFFNLVDSVNVQN